MKVYVTLVFASLLANALAQNDTSTTSRTVSPASPASTSPQPPLPTTELPTPPEPTPKVPQWSVKASNSTCVLLRGNFSFSVTYSTPSGNTVSDQVEIPTTAKSSGSCGPFLNSLILTWDQGNLTFMFIKKPIFDAGVDTGNGSYSLTTIFGRLTVKNPNEPGSPVNNNATKNGDNAGTGGGQMFYIQVKQPGGLMATTLQSSYSCQSYQSIPADTTGSVYLEMRDVQLEAFHDGLSSEFNPSETCAKDTVSSLLTIVGYVALAVLIAAAAGYVGWKKFGRAGYTEV